MEHMPQRWGSGIGHQCAQTCPSGKERSVEHPYLRRYQEGQRTSHTCEEQASEQPLTGGTKPDKTRSTVGSEQKHTLTRNGPKHPTHKNVWAMMEASVVLDKIENASQQDVELRRTHREVEGFRP